jgi:hypothetical protein
VDSKASSFSNAFVSNASRYRYGNDSTLRGF